MSDQQTSRLHRYQFISLFCASLATLIGLCGLCGWLLNNEFLRTFLSNGASMKINTALLLIAGGAGLVLLHKRQRSFARILFALMSLLSLGVIMEHLFNLNLHIDEFWLKDPVTDPKVEAPGRTSLLTALDALWIGLSLILLSAKNTGSHNYWPAAFLSSFTFRLPVISFISLAFTAWAVTPVLPFIRR